MPNARRSAGSIEDPVRSPSEARRGPTVLAPGSAAGRLQVAPWHRPRLDPDFAEERILWSRGYRHVAGIDEVGRGCLAGPVTAAAVILPPDWQPRGLRDSKLLKPEERRRLDVEIRRHAVAWAIAFVSPELIDRINILQATLLASTLAAARLPVRPDALLLDAVALPEVRLHQRVLVSADRLCASVAAASVIAKVARDALMVEFDAIYPGYGLAGNKGYAAPEHRAGLAALGLCPIHRLSFAPCRDREQMTLWQDTPADANPDGEIDEPDELEVAELVD
ncbi:MAG TPA: ribonuclease HII [Candidatus Limnocylindrales bacterium]|jgi:Ribonuclease HII|nr:ribonuclease HII [Candidatus Limnocylindrales bacterium]